MNSYLEKVYATLSKLENGWHWGGGMAYDRHELSWLMHEFDMNFDVDLPKPFFGPSVNGNVFLEWNWHDWCVSCDINLKTQTGDYHALNVATMEEHESILDFKSKGWDQLNSLLSMIYSS